MRPWKSTVLLLASSLLGAGILLSAMDVAQSSLERPGCRPNNFIDPQRSLPRIGQNCP
jgi:hypothetical protein